MLILKLKASFKSIVLKQQLSEDNIVHWRQANLSYNCQLVCVKSKVLVFV